MTRPDEQARCPACNGRGYHFCECWPGDCICGRDEEYCDECVGTGFVEPCYHCGRIECVCEEPQP